jgi:small subunit ribosomal protein S16
MLVIRMRQQGANSRQSFRLVVTDERRARDGKYIEMLGWYNPFAEAAKNLQIDVLRLQHWLNVGASISDRVVALLNRVAPEVVRQWTQKKVARREKLRNRRKKK